MLHWRGSSSLLWLILCAVLASCAAPKAPTGESARERLTPSTYANLKHWQQDNLAESLPALRRSCRVLGNKAQGASTGPASLGAKAGDWTSACTALASLSSTDNATLRRYYQHYFSPWKMHLRAGEKGLFTGYYEIALDAAPVRGGRYQTPLYGLPEDMLKADLSAFSTSLPERTLLGRVEGKQFVPYPDRAAIEKDGLARAEVLAWAADPVDVFFLHIQGSGQLRYGDGSIRRIGYAGKNGRAYVTLGKVMLERGLLTRENVSAPAIMDWLRAHPREGVALMQENPSYVFFTLRDGEGPIGSQGVPLTPERSLAVDRAFIPMGMPLWLETTLPDNTPYHRLMLAQDTGGAIKGPVRGDVFFGAGTRAASLAGHMKSPGGVTLLLPKPLAQRLQSSN